MTKNSTKKVRLYIISFLLIAGFSSLYLHHTNNQNDFSYEKEDVSIIVIDLSDKRSKFSIFLILGILFITIATVVAINTFYIKSISLPNLEDKLTKQELKVVSLIKQSKTNKEIAIDLSISLSTVKTHINNIYKKLEVKSRQELLDFY